MKRLGVSIVATNVSPTIGPTPGTPINRFTSGIPRANRFRALSSAVSSRHVDSHARSSGSTTASNCACSETCSRIRCANRGPLGAVTRSPCARKKPRTWFCNDTTTPTSALRIPRRVRIRRAASLLACTSLYHCTRAIRASVRASRRSVFLRDSKSFCARRVSMIRHSIPLASRPRLHHSAIGAASTRHSTPRKGCRCLAIRSGSVATSRSQTTLSCSLTTHSAVVLLERSMPQ